MASMMIKMGYPLLSDDLVLVKYHVKEGKFHAYPAYLVIKLWPQQYNRLFESQGAPFFYDRAVRKYRVRVDKINPDLFCNTPCPVSRIYHLCRREEVVRPLSNTDAMSNLIRYSLAAPAMIAMQWQPHRLNSFASLCTTHEKMRNLIYPPGINHLEQIIRQVLADFNGTGA